MKILSPLLAILALLSSSCTRSAEPEKIVVTVNGTPISEKQVLAEADRRIDAEAAAAAAAGMVYDESERNTTRAVVRDNVLHTLIERQLIADQLKTDHVGITDAEVDAFFLARAQERGQTLKEAEEQIKTQGKTLSDVKERIRWHTIGVMKLYELHGPQKKELTDAQAREVYDSGPDQFRQEHERRVSRILINAPPDLPAGQRQAARVRAEELLKRIKAGEDFAAVARAHSEDAATRAAGGDRGWSPRGFVTGPGSDPFGDAAFALKSIGDSSDVVETTDGYEIIKLTGIKEARQKSFEEVKAYIIERDRNWEIGNFWEQYATAMRDRARIEWDPKEKARREEKEKRDREYNEKMEKEAAQQQPAGEGQPPQEGQK